MVVSQFASFAIAEFQKIVAAQACARRLPAGVACGTSGEQLARTAACRRYPRCAMMASMRSRTSGFTNDERLSTRETVAVDTPAKRAMSC
jgi:hypothetical protein